MNLSPHPLSTPVDFRILAETEEFLAVDKPSGLLVHPTKPGGPPTLLDGLRELLAFEILAGAHIAIVNRLDRETSGIVLIAKTLEAARGCTRCMEQRRVHKEYEAICFGWPEQDAFVVDAPILRLGKVAPSRVWLLRAIHPQGQEARTAFHVLKRFSSPDGMRFCRLRAFPETGRTHQIRVHLQWAGFPIVGDKIYARGEQWYLRFIEEGWTTDHARSLLFPRHLLHATRIAFDWNGQHMDFSSPPDCLNSAEDFLHAGAGSDGSGSSVS